MNKSEELGEDILSGYIRPEMIEKAPSGFTESIMSKIQTEKVPSRSETSALNRYLVPVISGIITVTLIISAVLLSANVKDSSVFSVLKPLSDIRIVFPEINFDKFTGFTLPGLIIYISLGIFMLSLFDRVLNLLFHRERK